MASFLKKIFVPKWQHSDANVRLNALDQITDQKIISLLALEDVNIDVRLKALSLIDDTDTLARLFSQKPESIQQAAISQYLKLVLGSHDQAQQIEALALLTNPQHIMAIASFSPDQALAQAAINQLHDEDVLFDFIFNGASSKSRLLAAQKINDSDKLKTIEKHFLNKDKNLVRYVKNTLNEQAKIVEEQKLISTQIQQLLDNAQQLTQQAFGPTYAGQVAHLKQSINQYEISEQQQQVFDQAIAQCEKILTEHQQQQKAIEQQQAAETQAQSLQLQALNELTSLYSQCKSAAPNLADVTDAYTKITKTWTSANELSNKIDSQIKKEYESAMKPLVNLISSLEYLNAAKIDFKPLQTALENQVISEIKKNQKHINDIIISANWPQDFPENKLLNSIYTLKNEIETTLSDLQKGENKAIDGIKKNLTEFETAIQQGQIKTAKHLQSVIRKKLDQVDNAKTKSLHAQFQLSSQSLNELKDWQGFATLPKFEQLCADMESLIESDMDAKQKAKAIHDLQDQWKTLGALPNQKQQQALWQQFKAASDKAYEPCQAYFEDMAKLRNYNLEQRIIICEQLEQYFQINNWENANWKSAQQILDKAHDEFKKYSPVEHTQKKSILQRFHNATHDIHNKLVDHFKENAASKQVLIDQVIALKEQEDIGAAIEQCKDLQNQWKTKGNAGRAERQLWSAFRSECDALFEKRNEASQARKQHIDDNITKANTLVEAAQALTQTADSQSELANIKEQLRTLDLPAKVKTAIIKKLDDIQTQLQLAAKQEKRAAQHALWVNAQKLAHDIGQAEQTGQVDAPSIEAHIDSTELPTQVKAIFASRIIDGSANNQDTLHKLCLELEIILEVDSPAQDQNLRMALQVERLQRNMGQSLPSLEAQLESLQCRWFAVKAQDEPYESLHARFFDTLNAQFESLV